ncbi:MAG: phycocyanobilin:ferredoxin oxidoreductase, partial [Synechococcales cyanobacterium]
FPNPLYALPIFGCDLVGNPKGTISAAIADLSPVNSDRSLPLSYEKSLSGFPSFRFSQPRLLPEWGTIFSDYCLFIRPVDATEETWFLNRVRDYLILHCQIAVTIPPLTNPGDIEKTIAGQRHYCTKQQQNDKT